MTAVAGDITPTTAAVLYATRFYAYIEKTDNEKNADQYRTLEKPPVTSMSQKTEREKSGPTPE